MTRKDEIKMTADKYCRDEYTRLGFVAGAKWADRTMIDKACEWLDYHLTFNVAEWDEGVTTQRIIDKFRKAMQGK